MLQVDSALQRMFDVPRVYFTIAGQERSIAVLKEVKDRLGHEDFIASFRGRTPAQQECLVLDSAEAVQELFQSGISPSSAIALFDGNTSGRFRPTTQSRPDHGIPKWAGGAQWGVKVGARCTHDRTGASDCAKQLAAGFNRNFVDRLGCSLFPWGAPRKGERGPVHVSLPDYASDVLTRLNTGPNLAAAIADKEFALELPKGSRISWFRVPPDPLRCDTQGVERILQAFGDFERACASLVQTDRNGVHEMLSAGVQVDSGLRDVYLFPAATQFSVRRPDLHFTGDGLFSSENDEMPGGFAEAAHLDRVYGVNQGRWRRCFGWLTQKGLLLLLVSHEWSRCYIPEFAWLSEYLAGMGYPVRLLTTDHLDELSVRDSGVFIGIERIGTIWRQFPIFEARGVLVDIVRAAHGGRVRMVPEFAHFGNKTWFSVFRRYREFFQRTLDPAVFALLDAVLPDSHLVRSDADFPCRVGEIDISGLAHLRTLPQGQRDGLVLKLSGANDLTARSYGVLMGYGLTERTWREWIDARMALRQPFIVQRRLETGIAQLSVLNTRRRCGEVFNCRVLLRPWMVGGELVSVSACAVPSNTLRVHGRVDMALVSVALD